MCYRLFLIVALAATASGQSYAASYGDAGSYEDDSGSYVEADVVVTPAPATPAPATPAPATPAPATPAPATPAPETPAPATPAPAGNPEKPVFDKEAYEAALASMVVVDTIADVTFPPTKAPTAWPTAVGQVVITLEVVKKAVKTTVSFPVSAEEANNPVMQKALTDGVAKSLGLPLGNVRIGSVTANDRRGRRLAGGVSIEFIIISDDDSDSAMATLKANIATAGTEGSLVAAVKQEANAAGVLTASLKDMAIVITVTVADAAPVTVTVTKVYDEADAPATPAPTMEPTMAPTMEPTMAPTAAVLSGASAVGISQSCMVLAVVQIIVVALL